MIPALQFAGRRLVDRSVYETRRINRGEDAARDYAKRVDEAGKPFDDRIAALPASVTVTYRTRYAFHPRGAITPRDCVQICFPYVTDMAHPEEPPRVFHVTLDEQPLDGFKSRNTQTDPAAAFAAVRQNLWRRGAELAKAAVEAIGPGNITPPEKG